MASQAKSFLATLEKGSRALGWTIARVPFDPTTAWKKMVRLRVRGEINGFPFRTSLFPDAAAPGRFYILVNRTMQKEAGAKLGQMADFRLEPDLEPREAELPDQLAVLLDEEPGLRGYYDGLTEYMRREIGKWVMGVKSEEAQMRRAEQMAERLLATMEAERELPPSIAAALRQNPQAKAGWARMTAPQRRGELMAVFYYRTPDAQQRRIEKLCEVAARH